MIMKRNPRPIIAAAVLLGAGSWLTWRSLRPADESLFVSGTIEATEAEIGFEVSGRLERIHVREGDVVEPGRELATLERWELVTDRDAARARVAEAEAVLAELLAGSRTEEIARSKAMLAIAIDRRDAAKREVERLRPLAEQSLVTRQMFDNQVTTLSMEEGEVARAREELRLLEAGTRKERIAAQRATLAQATAALERIDAQLSQTWASAPFAGVITIRHREPGEAIASGSPVLTLQNLSDRWVRVYVPGDEVGKLSLGQCAVIASDGFADRRYAGAVTHIASVAEFTPRNVQSTKDRVRLVYEVRVRVLDDEDIDLKPGLPGDVTFATPVAGAPKRTACAVPASSRSNGD
jgi:HlyD family secretion protein